MLAKPSQILRDVLNGRLLVDEVTLADRPWLRRAANVVSACATLDEATLARRPWLRGIEWTAHALHAWLFGRSRPSPPEAGGTREPDAGRPAPLRPRPGHHLVAANALPPSDRTHLFPKD